MFSVNAPVVLPIPSIQRPALWLSIDIEPWPTTPHC